VASTIYTPNHWINTVFHTRINFSHGLHTPSDWQSYVSTVGKRQSSWANTDLQ